MNEIVNKFLLLGDKFMPEMHLKQPRFIYSAGGPFNKNKESDPYARICVPDIVKKLDVRGI